MSDADPLLNLVTRGAGAFLGAFMALVFMPPKTRREFLRRASFSVIAGWAGGYPLRTLVLHWPDEWQLWLFCAGLVSMLSWFVMEAAVRIIRAWKPKE